MRLFWDIDQIQFVMGLRLPGAVDEIAMTARDLHDLTVTLVQRDTIAVPYTPFELAAGETLLFTGKGKIDDDFRLWSAEGPDFVFDSESVSYSAEIELSTLELIAFINAHNSLFCLGEFSILKAGRNHHSTRLRVELINDVGRNEETPASMQPGLEFYVDPDTGLNGVRINNIDGEEVVGGTPPGA